MRADRIDFHESGPGLVAVADVLKQYLASYSGDAPLEKWLEDLLKAGSDFYKPQGA